MSSKVSSTLTAALLMAQVFNIYFTYENLTRSAIVSVRKTPFFTEYTLNNFDEELLQLLPGNKIISRSRNDFIFQEEPGFSSVLMTAIIKAVVVHVGEMQD
jgi:hypothetical protein